MADQLVEGTVSRTVRLCSHDRLLTPFLHSIPHGLTLLSLHEFRDKSEDFVALNIVVDFHADAPLVTRVGAVGLLVREEGPADDRYTSADALERWVLAAMHQERADRRVVQHFLLLGTRKP
jgi:hypothetical protein